MARSSGLSGLVKLAVLVGIVYLGYTQGLPWIQARLAGGGASVGGGSGAGESADEGAHCVRMAFRANEVYGDQIGRFAGPSLDPAAWSEFRLQVEGRISSARAVCGCGLDSCGKASQALSELEALLANLDGTLRNGGAGALNAGRDQESIQTLLSEAQALARSGS